MEIIYIGVAAFIWEQIGIYSENLLRAHIWP
jgi:hypothetical protein